MQGLKPTNPSDSMPKLNDESTEENSLRGSSFLAQLWVYTQLRLNVASSQRVIVPTYKNLWFEFEYLKFDMFNHSRVSKPLPPPSSVFLGQGSVAIGPNKSSAYVYLDVRFSVVPRENERTAKAWAGWAEQNSVSLCLSLSKAH